MFLTIRYLVHYMSIITTQILHQELQKKAVSKVIVSRLSVQQCPSYIQILLNICILLNPDIYIAYLAVSCRNNLLLKCSDTPRLIVLLLYQVVVYFLVFTALYSYQPQVCLICDTCQSSIILAYVPQIYFGLFMKSIQLFVS